MLLLLLSNPTTNILPISPPWMTCEDGFVNLIECANGDVTITHSENAMVTLVHEGNGWI